LRAVFLSIEPHPTTVSPEGSLITARALNLRTIYCQTKLAIIFNGVALSWELVSEN